MFLFDWFWVGLVFWFCIQQNYPIMKPVPNLYTLFYNLFLSPPSFLFSSILHFLPPYFPLSLYFPLLLSLLSLFTPVLAIEPSNWEAKWCAMYKDPFDVHLPPAHSWPHHHDGVKPQPHFLQYLWNDKWPSILFLSSPKQHLSWLYSCSFTQERHPRHLRLRWSHSTVPHTT